MSFLIGSMEGAIRSAELAVKRIARQACECAYLYDIFYFNDLNDSRKPILGLGWVKMDSGGIEI